MESEKSEEISLSLTSDSLESRVRLEFGKRFDFWRHEKIHIDRQRRQNSIGMTAEPREYGTARSWAGVWLGSDCSDRCVRTEFRFLSAVRAQKAV